MVVRCKMVCAEVGSREDGTHFVHMRPVVGDSEENKQFFKWTPGGKLELCVLRDQHFEPGKEYYVDITPAQDAQRDS